MSLARGSCFLRRLSVRPSMDRLPLCCCRVFASSVAYNCRVIDCTQTGAENQ
ncbi:hypothetical protein [Candidatus Ichthyocystis hellenicum]|uniref:hypothetical protein n=1 Tax=Candidatus Ichthyocystis hellenicum TaxID=1561003 RepID=UPI001585568A|nr:hypothetical protein [Candidatus Ichthyocystis hellenicum]